MVLNSNDTINGYNSVPFRGNGVDPALIPDSAGTVLYTIELGINYTEDEEQTSVDEVGFLSLSLFTLPASQV